VASRGPEAGYPPEVLGGLVRRAATTWPDKTAWVFSPSGETLSFGDIDHRSDRIAASLRSLGVEVGDRVAVMLPNVPLFPLSWLAIAKLGATMVPLNIHYRTQDAGFILDHSSPRAVVTSAQFAELISSIYQMSQVPTPTIVLTDQVNTKAMVSLPQLEEGADDIPPDPLYPEQIVNIQYTSGTTGQPKGCMLSQHYWIVLAELFSRGEGILGVSGDDVMLTAQPFYYIDPQWNVAVSLMTGAQLVVLDRFHPATFWEQVRKHHVTWLYCLGVMPTLLLRMPTSRHDREHSVRVILSSGIPMSLHQELEQRWGVPWFEVYGMTETGMDVRMSPDEHDDFVGSGCIGRLLPHRDARIVDDEHRMLERVHEGELLLRGIGMMEGYFRNDRATAEVFRDGWLHTGDIVRMDTDGRIFFVGRKKEFIRRSGENISAAEVEDVIKLHDAVEMVAAIPVPDDLRGEEVKAFVVLREEHLRPEADELAGFCSERLAYFKVPRYWVFCDDLPRTPSERIAKHRLLHPPYSDLEAHDLVGRRQP
jgi:crotonobetaine/carnitine-CoA ligase